MKASIYGIMMYVTPTEIPPGWPVPPAFYDPDCGLRNFHEGIEQLQLAEALGFDAFFVSDHPAWGPECYRSSEKA